MVARAVDAAATVADFYAEALPPQERAALARAGVGSLDGELRLARFRLLGLLRAEAEEAERELSPQGELALEPVRKPAAKTNIAEAIARQLDLVRKLELAALQLRLRSATALEDADADDAPLDDADEDAPPFPVR